MEDMKIQSSLYGHQPEILNDDHHIEMENIHFGVLSCRSQDDLLETSCQDNGENDQLSTADKTGNIEEGVSSATSAASSDDDPSPWRQDAGELSLSEVNGSIKIVDEDNASWFRKLLTFVGPGALVAVGYMDVRNIFHT